MRYILTALVAFSAGLGISCSREKVDPPVVESKHVAPVPEELRKQFDSYLLTTPLLETLVVRIAKRVLETFLVASVLALVTDYPIQAVVISFIFVGSISYPITRFLISREIRRLPKSNPPVLPN